MKKILNYFLGSSNQQFCLQHNLQINEVCYTHNCKYQRLICKHPDCNIYHLKHQLVPYINHLKIKQQAKHQMQFRDKILQIIDNYQQKLISYFKQIFQKSKNKLIQHINKQFTTKQFLQMQKLYHINGDYIPYLMNLQQSTSNELYKQLETKIRQNQKNIQKIITSQFIGLNITILSNAKLQKIINSSKIDKVRTILPFKCQLKLKFQASKNKFITKSMHAVDIRGPIILVVQSHKNKIFGGFSPNMFPRNQEYIQDKRAQCFLFSLQYQCILPIHEEYKRYSIRGGQNFWFGRGDLAISDECHKGNISWAEIGRAYKIPKSAYGHETQWLAGAWYFRVIQYEIYEVLIQGHK